MSKYSKLYQNDKILFLNHILILYDNLLRNHVCSIFLITVRDIWIINYRAVRNIKLVNKSKKLKKVNKIFLHVSSQSISKKLKFCKITHTSNLKLELVKMLTGPKFYAKVFVHERWVKYTLHLRTADWMAYGTLWAWHYTQGNLILGVNIGCSFIFCSHFIEQCDWCYHKMRQLFYYKMWQSFTTKFVRFFVTKCDNFITELNSIYGAVCKNTTNCTVNGWLISNKRSNIREGRILTVSSVSYDMLF